MVAKHLWRTSDGSIYGHCSCGRELKISEEYTDKKFRYVGQKSYGIYQILMTERVARKQLNLKKQKIL